MATDGESPFFLCACAFHPLFPLAGLNLFRSLQRPVTPDSRPRTSWAQCAVELTPDLPFSLPVTHREDETASAGDSPCTSPAPR